MLIDFTIGNDGYFIYTENQTHNINSYDPNDEYETTETEAISLYNKKKSFEIYYEKGSSTKKLFFYYHGIMKRNIILFNLQIMK